MDQGNQGQGTGTQSANLNQNSSNSQPKLITTVSQSLSEPGNVNNNSNGNISFSTINTTSNAPIVGKIISKLEDMKVSDLKAELKKRNLPVSGAKPQLIERLKPYTESVIASSSQNCANNSNADSETASTPPAGTTIPIVGGIIIDTITTPTEDGSPSVVVVDSVNNANAKTSDDKKSPVSMEVDEFDEKTSSEKSNSPMQVVIEDKQSSAQMAEAKMRQQQQKIVELQKELQKSQIQFQFQQSDEVVKPTATTVTIPLTNIATPANQFHIVAAPNPEPTIISSDIANKSLQRQILQQHLQQKIQQQQLLQNQLNNNAVSSNVNLTALLSNHVNASAAVKASLAAFLQNQSSQHQQQTPFQTVIVPQIIETSNIPTFQQVLLCPTSLATTINTASNSNVEIEPTKQHRTNSLPMCLPAQKFVSQR